MQVLFNYFISNFVLLIMLMGMMILTVFDVFLDRKMIFRLRLTLVMIFALSFLGDLEVHVAHLRASEAVVMARIFLSALCYSLRPIIVMMLIFITYKKAHWIITIPATLNVILSFSAFFTDIMFTITPQNIFVRGELGFTPYVVSIMYIIGLFSISFHVISNHSLEEGALMLFLAVMGALAALLTSLDYQIDIDLTYGAEILLYYLYMYGQYTKRDTLTGLLNRQSFYSDFKKHVGSITGIISIDMNELKWINDSIGHAEGDKALRIVADCLCKPATVQDHVYRIGGDEFEVICRKRSIEEMRLLVEDMREAVKESGYTCAFGLSANKTMKEMMREADERMYEDKARIKADILSNGGTLHNRT